MSDEMSLDDGVVDLLAFSDEEEEETPVRYADFTVPDAPGFDRFLQLFREKP